jgi:hypothetical protein
MMLFARNHNIVLFNVNSESAGRAIVVYKRTEINDNEYFVNNFWIRIKQKLIIMLTTMNIWCRKLAIIYSLIERYVSWNEF